MKTLSPRNPNATAGPPARRARRYPSLYEDYELRRGLPPWNHSAEKMTGFPWVRAIALLAIVAIMAYLASNS